MSGARAARMTEARAPEALAGGRTMDEVRTLVQDALTDKLVEPSDGDGYYQPTPWARDLSDDWVAYSFGGDNFKAPYAISDAGVVTIGDPVEVEVRTLYTPAPDPDAGGSAADDDEADPALVLLTEARLVESQDTISGRLLGSVGTDSAGGHIYRVRLISYGESKNGRDYPEAVMREAVTLYEGAKAYDHHRTLEELQTSTINGLVGSYRNVVATTEGIDGDLHLLPGATHTAEAFDASLANQAEGLPPLVGISHDVMGQYRSVTRAGRRLQEATRIDRVNSTDVVADPAAGGRATRMVAGGTGTTDTRPEEDIVTIEELSALVKGANPELRASLLEGLGIDAATLDKLRATEAGPAPAPPARGTEATAELVYAKDSVAGRGLVRAVLEDAKLDGRLAESIIAALPDRFSEADVTGQIATVQRVVEGLEKTGLEPRIPHVAVTKDVADKRQARMDAFFDGNWREGYHSFKQMAIDWTGINPYTTDPIGEDINRLILRECFGTGDLYDSSRSTESVSAASFSHALGDSVTRRMIAEYSVPDMQTWRAMVSSMPPTPDFRTVRVDRVGGFGTLPTVTEGAPYESLTSPTDEEVTASLAKKGGLEDWTLETIANDDVRLIQRTPIKLGQAAVQTLYRAVWDIFDTNVTCTYDSTALFASGHTNTDTTGLSGAAVGAGRIKMRQQTGFGDTKNVLSTVPKFLIVNSTLEEIAFEICSSAFAMPSAAPVGAATAIPNLHQGMTPIVVDYWSSTTKWYLAGDPNRIPTIEVGFYQGRQDPELFVQADQSVGSMFNADKLTWKIRHIWYAVPLEHRGLYRGNT